MRASLVPAVALILALPGVRAAADEPKAPTPPGFWTEDELRRIDRGLEAVNCDRKDLGFFKRYIDDPFRLGVVDRALDDPLSIGAEAEKWDRVVRLGGPSAILDAADGLFPGTQHGTSLPRIGVQAPGVPSAIRSALETWVAGAKYMHDSVEVFLSAFGPTRDETVKKALLSQVEKPSVALPGAEMKDDDFLPSIRRSDFAGPSGRRLRDAAAQLLHQTADLGKALEATKPAEWMVPAAGLRLQSAAGAIVIAGTGDDVHDEGDDVVLVIDLGGNDTWVRGASAGTKRPVSVCIDLAGDDRYVGRSDFSFGGALGGVAIQWDCAGNDLYDAGNCSLGAGILGVGVLVDEAGDDVYRSKDFGQGAGAFGVGILLDKAGNDLRHVDLYGQGYGSTWGCGVLADLAGNDVYDAGGVHSDAPLHRDRTQSMSQGFGFGMRPDASGGVGVLVDVAGNDRYSADIYGQGASYWFSMGLLIDDEGNDTYCLGHYGQGAGIHLSAGMLLDRAGQDLYYDEYGVGIGGAHDLAVGILVDRGGDDHYVGSGGSQGGALSNSVALLLDDSGDDEYTAVRIGASHGAAAPARDTGGIGLLLDGGGKDVFSEVERQGRVWTSGLAGVGFDDPTPPEAEKPPDPMGAAITEAEAKARVDKEGTAPGPDGKHDDLDKLWAIAIRWQVGDERVIGPIARARLVAMGEKALSRAIERLGTKDSLELEWIQALLPSFPKETVVPRLLEASKSKDLDTRRSAIRFLGIVGAAEAESRLVEVLADDDVRLQALRSLASLKKAPKEIAKYLRAPKDLEGVAAASCLGTVGDDEAIAALVGALAPDVPFLTRLAAEQRLAALGERSLPALESAAKGAPTVRARRSAIRALGASKWAPAGTGIRAALSDPDPWVRFTAFGAARALIHDLPGQPTRALAAALAAAEAAETDPIVRRLR